MSGTTTTSSIKLKRGDVLLKRADLWTAAHFVIALGQKIGGSGKATTVHAAICVNDNLIIESSGEGIAVNSLDGVATWKVYRMARGGEIPEAAAAIAMILADQARQKAGFGTYSVTAAAKSAFASDRDEEAVGADIEEYLAALTLPPQDVARGFFCSNFVVQCYSLGGEYIHARNGGGLAVPLAPIALDHATASPSDIATFFDGPMSNWVRVGEIQG